MARIKLYEGTPSFRGPGQMSLGSARTRFTASDFSSEVAGKAVKQTAGVFSEIQKKEQQAARIDMRRQISDDQVSVAEQVLEIETNVQPGAVGHTEQIRNLYANARRSYPKALEQEANGLWANATNNALIGAMKFTAVKAAQKTTSDAGDFSSNSINFVALHPELLESELEKNATFYDNLTGISSDVKIKLKNETVAGMYFSSGKSLIKKGTSPEILKEVISQIKDPESGYASNLSPEQYRTLLNLSSSQKEKNADDAEKKLNDTEAETFLQMNMRLVENKDDPVALEEIKENINNLALSKEKLSLTKTLAAFLDDVEEKKEDQFSAQVRLEIIDAENIQDLEKIEQKVRESLNTIYKDEPEKGVALLEKITKTGLRDRKRSIYFERFSNNAANKIKLNRNALSKEALSFYDEWHDTQRKRLIEQGEDEKLSRPGAVNDIDLETARKIAQISINSGIVPTSLKTQFKVELTDIGTDPQDTQQAYNFLVSQRELYGDSWPSVYRQLVEAKVMSPILSTAARLTDLGEAGPARALINASAMKNNINNNPALVNITSNVLKNQIASKIEDFVKTVGPDAISDDISNSYEAIKTLTKMYIIGGASLDEATQRASSEIINNNYDYVDTIRIPKGAVEPSATAHVLTRIISRLEKEYKIAPAPTLSRVLTDKKEILRQSIDSYKSTGQWVMMRGEQGVILVDAVGARIKQIVNGKPEDIILTWDMIKSKAKEYDFDALKSAAEKAQEESLPAAVRMLGGTP
tara:strand:- start:5156 stop:7420 length:2265 start_codon:yes stop_codon:yes gene_type:complete